MCSDDTALEDIRAKDWTIWVVDMCAVKMRTQKNIKNDSFDKIR